VQPILGVACTKMHFLNNHLDPFFYVGSGYVEGIAKSGGIPLILPLLTEADAPFRAMLDRGDREPRRARQARRPIKKESDSRSASGRAVFSYPEQRHAQAAPADC